MYGAPIRCRTLRVLSSACLAIASSALVMPAASAVAATQTIDLAVDDPRPVASAIDEIIKITQYPISYEDPEYAYTADVRNITPEIGPARDGGPILIPAGGTLEVRQIVVPSGPVSLAPDSRSSEKDERTRLVEQALRRILEVQASRTNGGRFGVRESPGMLHVVPTHIRNREGQWISKAPILDSRISIPPAERTAMDMLNEVCDALSEQSGLKMGLGSGPLRTLSGAKSLYGATDEPARDVLVRTLDQAGGYMTWRLSFSPNLRWYLLNIIPLRRPPEAFSPAPQSDDQPGSVFQAQPR